jgi:hypothetical protein
MSPKGSSALTMYNTMRCCRVTEIGNVVRTSRNVPSSSSDSLSKGNYRALANHKLNIEKPATINPRLYRSFESISSSQA